MSADEKIIATQLLELQRHAMLMYTSCGWFFDEVSGLETTQIIQYAARVIQLAESTLDLNLEPEFMNRLAAAKSNIPENGNGRVVYERFVKPAILTGEKAAAHFAISSLFESYDQTCRIYSFTVAQEDRKLFTAGRARLIVGRSLFTSEIVHNSETYTYAVLHMGDHHVNCGVRLARAVPDYEAMAQEMRGAFDHADFPELIRLIDRHFGEFQFTLKNLFRDEQRKVLEQVLAGVREDVHNTYRLITDRHATLMRFLSEIHSPPLRSLELAEEVVLNYELGRQFENSHFDAERVRSLLAECQATKVKLDVDALGFAVKGFLDRLVDKFAKAPCDRDLLRQLVSATDILSSLPVQVNLWKPQNQYFMMSTTTLPEARNKADGGDLEAKEWVRDFQKVGRKLGFRAPEEAN